MPIETDRTYSKKPIVLALSRHQHHHIACLVGRSEFDLIETDDWRSECVREINPDLLLTLSSEWYEAYACIQEARKLTIPSLYLMDGILEWRHQWTNPLFGAGGGAPYNQPLFTDKAACLGPRSIRTLETWGNIGKCELVGMPRFDHYIENQVKILPHEGRKRLLIMTANTPGFSSEQIRIIEQSLGDVRDFLSCQETWEPVWRVHKGLELKLGLVDNFPELRGKPLRDVLSLADAVLTTPSTVILESMLCGLPTSLLDYSNSPQYVQTAWVVNAKIHLSNVLGELANPPANRMLFQDEILHDNLVCYTPSSPRLIKLIVDMISFGENARRNNEPLRLPEKILPFDISGLTLPSKYFDLGLLYPEHPVYKNSDLQSLQHMVTQLMVENRNLHSRLKKSSITGRIAKILRRLFNGK